MKRHMGTVALIAIFLVGGGLVAWRAANAPGNAAALSGSNAEAPPVAVEIAPVASGTLRDVRVLSGTLEASTRFEVAAKVSGLIETMTVDLGDEIQRGQIVAEIDDAEFVQAVAQAEAELAVRQAEQTQASAELGRAQREYDRVKSLRDRGVASDVEWDEVSTTLASQKAGIALAEARVRQAEAALELAKIRLAYTNVRAVWEGGPDTATVSQRFEDAGDSVQVNNPVVAVVALDPLTAVVSITERDYARLHLEQTATLETDAIPGRKFKAHIARIAPIFREASRQARVELRVANPDRLLKPGMFARVSIVLQEKQVDKVIPLAALTKRDGDDVVFVLSDDRTSVHMVPVQVGIIDGERVEVTADDLQGEVVVLGQQLLADGSSVNIHPSAETADAEDVGA